MFEELKYPVVQAPMAGGLISADFVAQVSNFGFLGSVAGGYLSVDELRQMIRQVKAKTTNPFLVNIFIFGDLSEIENTTHPKPQSVQELERLFTDQVNPEFSVPVLPSEDEYVNLVIEEGVKYVSSTFGFFLPKSVDKLKSKNIKVIASCSSMSEVNHCIARGADAIIFQRSEAGGHKSGFTNIIFSDSIFGLFKQAKILHPNVPFIVAGGILPIEIPNFLAAKFNAVQLGSAFLLTHESNLSKCAREVILKPHETVVSKVITGRNARWLKNKLLERLSLATDVYKTPLLQHYATLELRRMAQLAESPDYIAILISEKAQQLKSQPLSDLCLEIAKSFDD